MQYHKLVRDRIPEIIESDGKICDWETLSDAELPKLMEMPEARQLLHITYGPILRSELRERFFATLHREEEAYTAAIEKHFDKHLSLLGLPRR